ncbi:MAG: hypothetical protein J6S49_05205 [Erysipelotrichaceae bacterium]|nr:hypothetical protein [Erysipelotrichaceae bacterium]
MPDIDSLSIRLTSSSSEAIRAIQAVIDKLGDLNMALNNYADDSKFVRGMNSLTGGLNGLSTAVKSIDVDKLKTLSSTLGSLAGNGEKMAKLNYVQSFSQFGAEAQKVNSQIKATVKDLASSFDIPKRGIKGLTAAVKDFYNANGDTKKLDKAENEIKNIVHRYNDLTKVAT